MAKAINRLTAVKVRNLATPGRHPDGNGLYLEISKSGSKAWTLLFSWQGKTRQMGLGSTTLVSLADAREKATAARKLVAEGTDPIAQRKASSTPEASHAFGVIALQYIEDKEDGWKNEKHKKQWRSTLETYAKPIWNKSVADVCVDDLLTILRPIWNVKVETAKRVRGRIEAVLDAAKVRGLRSGENPAAWRGNLKHLLVNHKKGPKRHLAAMPFMDVPAFLERLARVEGASARALELLIHTATRTSEAIMARWDEFDLDNALWIIPGERMKAGKEHRVPLSDQVVTLLKARTRSSEFVFPGQKKDKPLSNMAMNMSLRRLGIDHFTVHGFRSSFRDWCGECTTVPREIAEQALAHQVGNEVERAYRRGDALERRRALMQQWSAFISSN